MRRGPIALVLPAALLLAGCGRKAGPARSAEPPTSDRAVVSLEKVAGRAEPSGLSRVVQTFPRGTELKVIESREGFFRVQPPGGGDVWVEGGGFERKRDREEREKRAAAVAKFAAQPGRAIESAPVLLAPAYGAARWGEVDDGDDVEVILHDHDFYGIRLPVAGLAFVPARSVRLLPSEVPGTPEAPARRREIVPQVNSLGEPEGVAPATAAPPIETPRHAEAEKPLEALPPGAEPPALVVRVEPTYPEGARRMAVGGEVVLRVVVTAEGTVGKVDVVTGAPAGLTEAAVDAVARWRYRPARVGDRPVPVVKVVRVRFSPGR